MPRNRKIHPYKLLMWVGLASIVMLFAGLTSAYIVKRNQPNWQGFDLPMVFWYSTIAILLSSAALYMATKNMKERVRAGYNQWLLVTVVLGVAFMVMQWVGFIQLQNSGIRLVGLGSNVSGSFLAVIAGFHLLHVLGGVIALLVLLAKSLDKSKRTYSSIPVEVASTYWHFVGGLWIYLFIFFQLVS